MAIFKHRGDFKKTSKFLENVKKQGFLPVLEKLGREGVDALAAATPIDSGETAKSWQYDIRRTSDQTVIYWYNTNVVDGVNIAIILQYGHGTGTGGFVQGRNYINPAIRPVFDRIAEEAWKGVTSS